jgi:hypothetical protein
MQRVSQSIQSALCMHWKNAKNQCFPSISVCSSPSKLERQLLWRAAIKMYVPRAPTTDEWWGGQEGYWCGGVVLVLSQHMTTCEGRDPLDVFINPSAATMQVTNQRHMQ